MAIELEDCVLFSVYIVGLASSNRVIGSPKAGFNMRLVVGNDYSGVDLSFEAGQEQSPDGNGGLMWFPYAPIKKNSRLYLQTNNDSLKTWPCGYSIVLVMQPLNGKLS